MKAKKLFFKECHLAGRQYHDVDEVWDELKIFEQDLKRFSLRLLHVIDKE